MNNKHIDIDSYIDNHIDFPPSRESSLIHILSKHNLAKVRDWCKKEESDIREINDIPSIIVDKVKEYLEDNDLFFGMSDEELVNYQDIEYYLEHPDEYKFYNPTGIFEKKIRESIESREFKPLAKVLDIPSLDDPEEQEEYIDSSEEKRQKEIQSCKDRLERLDKEDRQLYKSRFWMESLEVSTQPGDWEYFRQAIIREELTHKPWLYKLFVPLYTRIREAIDTADAVIKEVRRDADYRESKNLSSYTSVGKQLDKVKKEYAETQNKLKELEKEGKEKIPCI